MSALASYSRDGSIAVINMDDGKRNALSPAMLEALNSAFGQAKQDNVVTILQGRPGTFSAGFDLKVLGAGGRGAAELLSAGFELAQTVFSFPTPVVVACTGHALAMGLFLLLSADYRIGASGPFKLGANEVAIGMTLPHTAVEICRQRLAPAHFHRATLLAEVYDPESAVPAGLLDRVVPEDSVSEVARSVANELAKLNMKAHAATKLRVRAKAASALRAAYERDAAEFRALA